MILNPRLLSSAAAVAIVCAVSAAAYYYKSRNTEFNEVMVFCKLQFNAFNSFDKMISYVEAANKCVNVCMPAIHNPAIQGRLVTLLKKKNIKLRIIIDRSGYNESTDFLTKELIDAGAEVKCKLNRQFYKMEHKFCLVDDKVLMTGTLNWGDDRSADHWNYVYITSKKQLVEPVKNEFYHMWNSFSYELPHEPEPPSYDCSTEMEGKSEVDANPSEVTELDSLAVEPHTVRETVVTPEICLNVIL